jgi:ferredoxin--NADP+ reductase
MPPGSDGGKAGGKGLNTLLKERGIKATCFDDWRTIEAAEVAAARPGSPREKLVRHEDWLKALGH